MEKFQVKDLNELKDRGNYNVEISKSMIGVLHGGDYEECRHLECYTVCLL
jgi:hypothetical protein